VEDYAVLIKV